MALKMPYLRVRRIVAALLVILFVAAGAVAVVSPTLAAEQDTIRVAYFSRDVPAIEPLSPAFDPDSYAVITQIFDTLVYLDLDGRFQPGLATDWERIGPTLWVFTLRKGVTFHNGEPFDARAVKFTYDYVITPDNLAGNAWILSSIARIELDPEDPFRVYVHTRFPDGMFLNRLSMFGSICPPEYVRRVGIEEFAKAPVGTGPYKFVRWQKGRGIDLQRNENYWRKDIPKTKNVRFEILPKRDWINAFLRGDVDFLPNLGGDQTARLMRQAKGNAKIIKRLVLSGYWVLLRNRGALADVRIRRALNLALDKNALIRYADQGNAVALSSLGKKGEFGANPELSPYPYDIPKAKELIAAAGWPTPIKLKAIVADIAAPVAKIMRFDFSRVGVDLDLTVVSRAEWANRVVGYKIANGKPADYDLAVNLVDNPIYNLAFHAGLFLHSVSPWALTRDEDFDAKFEDALQVADAEEHRRRLEALDRYIHEQALMIFTTQRIITAAVKPGLHIPKFALSGHLDYLTLTTAEFGAK